MGIRFEANLVPSPIECISEALWVMRTIIGSTLQRSAPHVIFRGADRPSPSIHPSSSLISLIISSTGALQAASIHHFYRCFIYVHQIHIDRSATGYYRCHAGHEGPSLSPDSSGTEDGPHPAMPHPDQISSRKVPTLCRCHPLGTVTGRETQQCHSPRRWTTNDRL